MISTVILLQKKIIKVRTLIHIAQELEFMGSKPTALESKPLSPQAQNFGQEVHPDEEIPF